MAEENRPTDPNWRVDPAPDGRGAPEKKPPMLPFSFRRFLTPAQDLRWPSTCPPRIWRRRRKRRKLNGSIGGFFSGAPRPSGAGSTRQLGSVGRFSSAIEGTLVVDSQTRHRVDQLPLEGGLALKKLRLTITCLACVGLLAVPAGADAQKQKPGANQKQGSAKCRVLSNRVSSAGQAVAAAQAKVARAKAKVSKRKAAYNRAKSKGKKAKARARKRLRKAKRSLKAAKAELASAQARLASENRRFAQSGCGG